MRILAVGSGCLLVALVFAGCSGEKHVDVSIWLSFEPESSPNYKMTFVEVFLRRVDRPEQPPSAGWEDFRLNDFGVESHDVGNERNFSRGRLPLFPARPFPAADFDAIHLSIRNLAIERAGEWVPIELVGRPCLVLPSFDAQGSVDVHLDLDMERSLRPGDTFLPTFTRATGLDIAGPVLWDWHETDLSACGPEAPL